ncbi:MAG: hypothetical protein ABS81_03265 [Pseudonocardia sp. SCN 72-86]|nr:MAG: hypothetical protein ABS81_03265 [Pseudonocardia sp. SCN 72-86]
MLDAIAPCASKVIVGYFTRKPRPVAGTVASDEGRPTHSGPDPYQRWSGCVRSTSGTAEGGVGAVTAQPATGAGADGGAGRAAPSGGAEQPATPTTASTATTT